KGRGGRVLYVGKARNLKSRVSAYFNRSGAQDPKTAALVARVHDLSTVVTATEKEALILESNLIKRHRPRYNVMLKDGKRYPSLGLDTRQRFPHLEIVRKTDRKDYIYFGPFASAKAVRETLRFINKTFKVRKCKNRDFNTRQRPCLHFQMDACLAPCFEKVSAEAYQKVIKEVVLFLKGRTPELARQVRKEMTQAAADQDFERAAALRDKLFALERTLEKQVAVTTDFQDRDGVAVAQGEALAVISVFFVRGGYLMGSRHFEISPPVAHEAELVRNFIRQHYETSPFIPKEILIPVEIEDRELLAEGLSQIRGGKVWIKRPQRGEKARFMTMVKQNATKELAERCERREAADDLLLRLQKRLKLTRLPLCIECYDNSTLGGSDPVAARAVFQRGRPDKAAHRRYRLRALPEPDDYAYMQEVLGRRFAKDQSADHASGLPDLLLVDGGKGQLNVALAVLKTLGLRGRFDVAGIAKPDLERGESEEKFYLPGRANPIYLGRERDLLLFMQRIRDEAHRLAVTFQRRQRRKSMQRSILDDVPGIGPRRKKALLTHFGGVDAIREADPAQLAAVPGMNRDAARALREFFKGIH
ncbi:MAG: excinuclease ABC subunit UvrC, partial [Desulfobacterales bacterium]